ncbi:MAG: hypothetical protein ACR2J9_03615, partial [Gaiellales bacterium]
NVKYTKKMFTTGSWQKDFASMRGFNADSVKEAGGLRRFLKYNKYEAVPEKGETYLQAGRKAAAAAKQAEAEADQLVFDVFAGRTSVGAKGAASEGQLLVSQQHVSSSSLSSELPFVPNTPPSNSPQLLKQRLSEQFENGSNRSSDVFDEIAKKQRTSFSDQKRTTQDFMKKFLPPSDEVPQFVPAPNANFAGMYAMSLFKF